MYVRPIWTLLLTGRSTPTTRAIILNLRKSVSVYPWRCLCLGLVQITRTTPLRWMILQLSHIFLTEALTFIASSPLDGGPRHLLVTVGDPPPVQIVRRKLDQNPVARQDADEVLPHLPRHMR